MISPFVTTWFHITLVVSGVWGTSVKMDFLPFAVVRTDPILSKTCLSDHLHTFYGAASVNSLRPEATYSDLRSATGNSGNVKENPSLYWHPTVFKYEKTTGTYTQAPIWFTSAYYVWETGVTKAWPDGFKMIAYSPTADSPAAAGINDDGTFGITHTKFECSGPSPCERSDCSVTNNFFPATQCSELEVSFRFPSCWDGVNKESPSFTTHVAYTSTGEADDPCPASHPVKIPQIRLYFRIRDYEGGAHEFSDGTGRYHSDYWSGWNQTELQSLLDDCSNPSETAAPDAFCENILTYRGSVKQTGVAVDDDKIEETLKEIQGPPLQPQVMQFITTEANDGISTLPRGECSGALLSMSSTTSTSLPSSVPSPTPTALPTPIPLSSSPTPSSAPTPSSTSISPPLPSVAPPLADGAVPALVGKPLMVFAIIFGFVGIV